MRSYCGTGVPSGLNVLGIIATLPEFWKLSNWWRPEICIYPILFVFPTVANCPFLWSRNITWPFLALLRFLMAWVPVTLRTPLSALLKLFTLARSISTGSPLSLNALAMLVKFPVLSTFFTTWLPDTLTSPALLKFSIAAACPYLWSCKTNLPFFSFEMFLNWWVPVLWVFPPALFTKLLKVARSMRVTGFPLASKVLGAITKFPELVAFSNWWFPETFISPALLVF